MSNEARIEQHVNLAEAGAIFRRVADAHNAAIAINSIFKSSRANSDVVKEQLADWNVQYHLVTAITELVKTQREVSGDPKWVPISCVHIDHIDKACQNHGCKEVDRYNDECEEDEEEDE